VLAGFAALSTVAAGLSPLSPPASAVVNAVPVEVGARPGATRLSFTLADRVSATVDVGTGNLQVTSKDLTLPGIGSDVQLGLDFNSLLLGAGSPLPAGTAGPGWAMRLGADTKLVVNPDSSVLYLAPEGLEGLFTPGTPAGTYNSAAGFKADLVSTSGPAGWTLSEHSSGRVLTFNAAGRLTKVADRNANPTTFAYTSGGLLSSVTSSRGGTLPGPRLATVTSNAAGLMTGVSQTDGGSTTRSVSYAYTAGQLTGITDALNHTTTFGYDATTGDLMSVTNNGGALTQFVYTTTHKVSKVTQLNPSAGSPGNSATRLAYTAGNTTLVADPTTDQTQGVAAVPHTTYTLDSTDRVLSAVDPDGNTRSQTYTAGFDVASSTIGTGATGSTSTASYGANGGESLTGATAPTGATAGLAYTNTGAGSKFSPSGSTDSQGNSSALAYDTAGNQTSGSTTALAATAKVTYRADGTVATATDPANGTNSTGYTAKLDHPSADRDHPGHRRIPGRPGVHLRPVRPPRQRHRRRRPDHQLQLRLR